MKFLPDIKAGILHRRRSWLPTATRASRSLPAIELPIGVPGSQAESNLSSGGINESHHRTGPDLRGCGGGPRRIDGRGRRCSRKPPRHGGGTAKPAAAKAAAFDASACFGCHAPIKAFYAGGKHKRVGCNTCHDGTAEHLADPSKRPATKTDLATCGACHQNQYKTYAQMDWHRPRASRRSRRRGPAPDPA